MRRARFSKISSKLVEYLVERRGMTQVEVAGMLDVDKSFVSRVRAAERELSPTQMETIAERLGVPLGAMLIDAADSGKQPELSPERQAILDLCTKLMHECDEALEASRAELRQRKSLRK